MKRITLSLVLLTGLFFNAFTQQNMLDEAWAAFEESNYKLAQAKFEKATNNASTKAEANIGLSILFHTENESKKSFEHFKSFYESSSDPMNELYALWKTESVSNGRGKLSPERLTFHSNLDFSNQDGMYNAINNEFLNNHYLMANQISKSRQYGNQDGVIKEWNVLGNFDNVSASGFSKNHGALENPQSSKVFKNKNEADVQWFDVSYMPISNWLATTHYFLNTNTIIYGQSFCNSESAQDAQIRVGTYGSFRLWVNDVLVMEEEEEQITDVDAYTVNVKLNKGTNRILVQMGCSELSNSAIFVRLTDKKGNPLNNVEFSSNYSDYTKGGNKNPTIVELPAEKHFKEKIKQNPKDILNYILLYYTYEHNGKTQKNLELMKKADKLFPENTLIKSFLVGVYADVDNETDMSKELEKLKEMAPESYQALTLEFEDKHEKEEYDEAEEVLEKMISLYGQDIVTTAFEIQLASAREQNEKLISIVKRAYKSYPENSNYVYLRYLIYDQVENKKRKGVKTLKKFISVR